MVSRRTLWMRLLHGHLPQSAADVFLLAGQPDGLLVAWGLVAKRDPGRVPCLVDRVDLQFKSYRPGISDRLDAFRALGPRPSCTASRVQAARCISPLPPPRLLELFRACLVYAADDARS